MQNPVFIILQNSDKNVYNFLLTVYGKEKKMYAILTLEIFRR
jgi:hypothetical protein